jgi:hypothetical protein
MKPPQYLVWVGGWGLVWRTGHARAVALTSAKTRSGTGTNRQRKCRQRMCLVSTLMAASLVRERACCGQQGPHRSLVATAPLCECKSLGLHKLCSRLVATALLSERECQGLLSPCGTLDVLALNVCEDYVQRASKEFACRLDAPDCGIKKIRRHYLVAGLPARKRARSGQRGPRRSLVLKALLDKHEGLGCCSPCAPPPAVG